MREICTSGSVRGEGGNILTYSALGAAQRGQVAGEGGSRVERGKIGKKAQLASHESGLQTLQEQAAEELLEDRHGQEKPGTAGHPAAVERRSATGDDAMQTRMVVEVLPQVWSTAMVPNRAPRRWGSAAIRRKVSAAAVNSNP